MWNGSSAFSNGSSYIMGMDDRAVRTLPYIFRALLPIRDWR